MAEYRRHPFETIRANWDNFLAKDMAPEAPEIQRSEMQRAFMAGIGSGICLMLNAHHDGDLMAGTAKLHAELRAWLTVKNASKSRPSSLTREPKIPKEGVACPRCRKELANLFELVSHLRNDHQDLPGHTLDMLIRIAARRADARSAAEQIGWEVVPLRKPPAGSIVTQAFIRCMSCGGAVSTTGGPRTYAMCLKCWPPAEAAP